MKDENSNPEQEIVKKLDKVADSLESTTSHLSSVVTQQQLDLIRERVSKCESEIAAIGDLFTGFSEKSAGLIEETSAAIEETSRLLSSLDKDHTATRALTFSAFALGTVSVIGLVVCSLYL